MNDRIPGGRTAYFAYGSNMDTARLRSRVPSATAVGPAKLPDERMLFSKKSADSSGKANLVDSPGDVAWGVLFEVDATELAALDSAEGGYERTSSTVCTPDGNRVVAQVYVSTELTADATAYDWYKSLVVEGAREHKLPQEYLDYLERLPSKPDPRKGQLP